MGRWPPTDVDVAAAHAALCSLCCRSSLHFDTASKEQQVKAEDHSYKWKQCLSRLGTCLNAICSSCRRVAAPASAPGS